MRSVFCPILTEAKMVALPHVRLQSLARGKGWIPDFGGAARAPGGPRGPEGGLRCVGGVPELGGDWT